MIGVSVNTTHITIFRKFNIWYSIMDGNFNDPKIWISNGAKKHSFPQAGDDIVVNNNITLNVNATLKNVTVNGTLTATASTLVINGNLKVSGTLNLTSSSITIYLCGYDNFINSFIPGTSTISYNGLLNQPILPLSYYHMAVCAGNTFTGYASNVVCTKYLTGDTIINGNLSIYGVTFEIGSNSLTVGGITTSYNAGSVNLNVIQKSTAGGTIIFIGNVSSISATFNWNFTANDNVEFRGGLGGGNLSGFTMGTASYHFTTNNQTISANNINLTGTFVIGSGIIVTLTGAVAVTGSFTGDSSTSQLNVQGTFQYSSAGAVGNQMATGVFNYNASPASIIYYAMNGAFTIPYGTYSGLSIGGTGTKTLSQNTTVTNLIVGQGTLELGSYNFTATGTTFVASSATLSKSSSSGSCLFIGLLYNQFGAPMYFAGTVECRGGITTSGQFTSTGTLLLTTNNQTLTMSSTAYAPTLANILVSGPITVIFIGSTLTVVTGTINGDNSSSVFDNRGTLNYQNASAPMTTGTLKTNSVSNTFLYNLTGTQIVTAVIYSSLILGGSGSKQLTGNTYYSVSYLLNGSATLNANGYVLTHS